MHNSSVRKAKSGLKPFDPLLEFVDIDGGASLVAMQSGDVTFDRSKGRTYIAIAGFQFAKIGAYDAQMLENEIVSLFTHNLTIQLST
jgi:hypothetical protein